MSALSRKTETIGPRYTDSDSPGWENDDSRGDTYSAYRDVKKKRKPALSAEKRVPIVSRIPKQFQASIKVTLVKPLDRSLLLISFSLKDGILHFARSTIQKAERRCPG